MTHTETICGRCSVEFIRGVCPVCGRHAVSVPDETMDTMIEQASQPSLATLFRRAKDSGLIKPMTVYGGKT